MKNIHMNGKTTRLVLLVLVLSSMMLLLCACTASDDDIRGIWQGKASDFAETDEKLAGSDSVYYLNIKSDGAFDLFELQEKGGKTIRSSLLKQPGTYRLSGGWIVLNEAAAAKPYVDGNMLSLKNGEEAVKMQRVYEVTYVFSGDVPRTQSKKLPKDEHVYSLGDTYEVDDTFEAGFTEDRLAASEGKIYTFLGWDRESGEITGDVLITGTWSSEPVKDETVNETNEQIPEQGTTGG